MSALTVSRNRSRIPGKVDAVKRFVTSSSVWTPLSLPSCEMWLDVSQLTGLNDNDDCTTWTDYSGNARHATGPVSFKPKYRTNIQNGKPVLRFDAVSSKMTGSYTSGSTFTMYLVEISSSGIAYARSVSNGDAGAGDCISIGVRTSGNNCYVDGLISSSKASYGAHQCALTSNGSTKSYYVDGVAIATGVANSSTLSVIGFGAANTTYAEPCGADLAEFILYSSEHNSTDRATVESYLRTKWGLP